MRVLVSVASKHGATEEIAEAIVDGLLRRGLDALAAPAEIVHDVARYDAVVLGSAVYGGHWLPAARKLAELYADALAKRPVWLFSSGPLCAADGSAPLDDEPVDVTALMQLTRAVGHRLFTGKLDKSKLSSTERAIVKALNAPGGDFRDWEAIDAFAGEIAQALVPAGRP